MGTILAIDPGNIKSGYVVVEHDGEEIRRVLEAGKKGNNELLPMLERKLYGNGHADIPPGRKTGPVRLAIGQRCKHPAGPRRPLRARPAEFRQGHEERPRFLLRFLSRHVGGYGGSCDVFR